MDQRKSPAGAYYDEAWAVKLARPEYATLDRRWRSRWDFVADRVQPGSKILDIGCGDGVLGSRLVRERSCSVTGVDVSKYAIGQAGERGVQAQHVDIDTERLPFEDRVFDAVIASCVLEHVGRPEHVMSEAWRILEDGGIFYVSLPNPMTWKIRAFFLFGRFHPDFLHSLPGEGIHYRFWPIRDGLELMLRDLGLRFTVDEKSVELKNPKLGSPVKRAVKRSLIRVAPGLFGEYVHFALRKESNGASADEQAESAAAKGVL
jgi:methionine biosynthesis protein MetW